MNAATVAHLGRGTLVPPTLSARALRDIAWRRENLPDHSRVRFIGPWSPGDPPAGTVGTVHFRTSEDTYVTSFDGWPGGCYPRRALARFGVEYAVRRLLMRRGPTRLRDS